MARHLIFEGNKRNIKRHVVKNFIASKSIITNDIVILKFTETLVYCSYYWLNQ